MPALSSQITLGPQAAYIFVGKRDNRQANILKKQIKSHTVETARMKLIEALRE